MKLGDVMDELAAAARTIPSLHGRSYGYPISNPSTPSALVPFPDATFDLTAGRGMDNIELSVVVLVSPVSDRASRDLLIGYMDGAGPESIKQAIEAYDYSALDSVRVESVTVEEYVFSSTVYLAAVFALDVIGSGSNN